MFSVIDGTNSINNTTDNPFLGALELDAGDNLLVQSSGYILATGAGAMAVYLDGYGQSDTITVNGLVFGTDMGIYSLGQYAKVTVNGQVLGNDTGVSIASSSTLFVGANGEVSGGEGVALLGNSVLVNNGTVNGTGNDAIQLSSGTINNNGLISSQYDAIFYDADGAGRINNTGTIQGDLSTYYNASASTAQLTISNSGTWDGNLDLSPGSDAVTNSGHITGSVSLGSGTNTLDSRHGQIDGSIYGGTGVDTIIAGGDGETIYGGGGHDLFYAGSGQDTFIIASAKSADTDRIRRFDAAQDTIELVHSVFTHLVPGQDPVFSNAAAATSASDHLFYNSSTGGLFYDSNGSAAGGTYQIATLDKGLKLAASNFSVV